jgi:hypothetical protein
MPRIIEQIRESAVPVNVMRTASKGALDVPSREMIEILVYLAGTMLFGEDASLTLAVWDEAACREVCSDPQTPKEVLDYFMKNRRPRLMGSLLDNPAIPESALLVMAQEESAESAQLLLASARAKASANVLHALESNPVLTTSQMQQIREALQQMPPVQPEEVAPDETDAQIAQFVAEHAEEIAAEEGKAFELVGEPEPDSPPVEEEPPRFVPAAPKARTNAQEEKERFSPLQKIQGLTVGERVQLAMKGNKEERFILVRDGSKVVSSAVLESPKLSDQEIETFASMKNVQESVLRSIAGKRRFMKIYAVVRALASNPRCPLDVQLTIMKNLLNMDLRNLSMNKNVSDTVRKVAAKMFRERTEKKSPF